MPYIDDEKKKLMEMGCLPATAGELNYAFTAVSIAYLEEKGESYQTYNDIIGALEGAKLELYRRKVSKYEDKKIKENGDVYR